MGQKSPQWKEFLQNWRTKSVKQLRQQEACLHVPSSFLAILICSSDLLPNKSINKALTTRFKPNL